MNRRHFLQLAAGAGIAGVLPALRARRALAQTTRPPDDRRFLFTIAAFGGACITDSFLPLAQSAVQPPGDPDRIVAYPDTLVRQPNGSNLRSVANIPNDPIFSSDYRLERFLERHYAQMAVLPITGTSVNHIVAQKRAITGAGIDGGRTIMEAVAERHGEGMPLPNCNMAAGGYVEPGDSSRVPLRARAEIIGNPALFGASTHGYAGQLDGIAPSLIDRSRGVREELDALSHFGVTFEADERRAAYLNLRREGLAAIEAADLINRLLLVPDSPEAPLRQYGLEPLDATTRERLLDAFPRVLEDPLHAQGALAFLLAREQISCAITIGPNFQPVFLDSILGTPLAFDYSHNNHVNAQYIMWGRILEVMDGLIGLLNETPFDAADPGRGSIWERSLMYVATDFGRERVRPPGSFEFGTGHELNNGNLFVSPLLRGNRVHGGVDPTTGYTFGRDAQGAEVTFREGDLYSAVAHAMDVAFEGRTAMDFLFV